MDKAWGSLKKIAAASQSKKGSEKKKKRSSSDPLQVQVVQEPLERKRKKRDDILGHRDVALAVKRVAQFSGHGLMEEEGLLKCSFCNKHIAFKLKSSVRQHCLGYRGKGMSRTSSKVHRHTANMHAAAEKKAHQNALDQAVESFRDLVWSHSGGAASAAGSTLPTRVIADRVDIVEVLWATGIPLAKLRNPQFLDLVESAHGSTGGYSQIVAQQPVAVQRTMEKVRTCVQGRHVSITADGSKINFSVEAMLARFVTDPPDLMPRYVCVGVSAPPTSLTAHTLELAFRDHLKEAGIETGNVVGVITDSGQPNPAVFGASWNVTARQRFFGKRLDDEMLLWIPCLMHAMSNLGTRLRKSFPLVKMFMSGYKKMSNTSEAARALWRLECKADCPRLADKSFWKWWDCVQTVLLCWASLARFLKVAGDRGMASKSVAKMQSAFAKPELKIQLEFCVTAGLPFRHAGFLLECDGFALPFVQGRLSVIGEWCEAWKVQRLHHPTVHEATFAASALGLRGAQIEDVAKSLVSVASNVVANFERAVLAEMSSLLPLYRAAGLLHPARYMWEHEKADFTVTLHSCVDTLTRLKGIVNRDVLRGQLLGEHPEYVRAAKEWKVSIGAEPGGDTPARLWDWWRAISAKVPAWFTVAKILVLLQPSSAAIERFYSLVKANSDDTQGAESQETLASRCMLMYNT